MVIEVPYTRQGPESSNCGPCTLKMVADYYGVRRPDGSRYSTAAFNRMLNVEFDYGCEKRDMNRVLKRLGLTRFKVTLRDLPTVLKAGIPVICLFVDETGEGHYSVITGVRGEKIYFNDSYHGRHFTRSKKDFTPRLKSFGNWLWGIVSSFA